MYSSGELAYPYKAVSFEECLAPKDLDCFRCEDECELLSKSCDMSWTSSPPEETSIATSGDVTNEDKVRGNPGRLEIGGTELGDTESVTFDFNGTNIVIPISEYNQAYFIVKRSGVNETFFDVK